MTTQDARPVTSADNKTEKALEDTFPASDPSSQRGQVGARAVPAAELMSSAETAQAPADARALSFRFGDATSAKLGVEGAVRDAALDRSLVQTDGATVQVQVSAVDVERVSESFRKSGGEAV